MQSKLQTIRLLNGLAQINRERAAGYNKALAILPLKRSNSIKDLPIEMHLADFLNSSRMFERTLENIVIIEGGKMPYGLKVDQHLYQLAGQLKTIFANMNSQSIVSSSKACEQLVQEAYDFVLAESRMAPDPKEMVARQKQQLQQSFSIVNSLVNEFPVENIATAGMSVPFGAMSLNSSMYN